MLFTILYNLVYSIPYCKYPPITNIYKTQFNIPLIGTQIIQYQRLNDLVSNIYLDGIININTTITIHNKNYINNIYYFYFDENICDKLNKIKCEIDQFYYDSLNDIICFNIYLYFFKFKKTLTLKNINNL